MGLIEWTYFNWIEIISCYYLRNKFTQSYCVARVFRKIVYGKMCSVSQSTGLNCISYIYRYLGICRLYVWMRARVCLYLGSWFLQTKHILIGASCNALGILSQILSLKTKNYQFIAGLGRGLFGKYIIFSQLSKFIAFVSMKIIETKF